MNAFELACELHWVSFILYLPLYFHKAYYQIWHECNAEKDGGCCPHKLKCWFCSTLIGYKHMGLFFYLSLCLIIKMIKTANLTERAISHQVHHWKRNEGYYSCWCQTNINIAKLLKLFVYLYIGKIWFKVIENIKLAR